MTTPAPSLKVLTPELRAELTKRTDLFLLHIIRANSTTQYACQTPSLASFRAAVAQHGTTIDATLLTNFRTHVPVTDYESYKPWIARFNEHPCKQSRVDNLLAPGLPHFIGLSSSTSGKEPKLFPEYQHKSSGDPSHPSAISDFDIQGSAAWILYYGHRELKTVEQASGQVVKRIPVCLASGGRVRMKFNWDIDSDESRLSTILPGQVMPWGAGLVTHNQSYLMIHALFCLACPDLDEIAVTFAIVFVDLIRVIDQAWGSLVGSIREGRIPDLEGIDHLRVHLQRALNANPARADELSDVGPPSSGDGWAARVWPRLRWVVGICSGPFGMCLPQVRAILGPTIVIRNLGYGSSESSMATPFDPNDLNTFVFATEDALEFVDANTEVNSQDILQAWDLKAGGQYCLVLTTRNGLWRYLMDDIIEIIGFDPSNGVPVFKYIGRKSSVMRLLNATELSDVELMAAVRAINSENLIRVLDFTTVTDERETPQAPGFIVELSGPLGPNAHRAAQRLSEVLGTEKSVYTDMIQIGKTRPPTIRIVAPGTFMEYRRWRGENLKIGLGQVKVPVVLSHAESIVWMLERVTHEL